MPRRSNPGSSAFVANRMVCHGDNMSGLGEAPAIAGKAMMINFGARTTKDLFDTIKAEMPFGAPGSLSDETYTNLVAFILHANGAATGSTAFTPTTAVKISSIANGTVPAGCRQWRQTRWRVVGPRPPQQPLRKPLLLLLPLHRHLPQPPMAARLVALLRRWPAVRKARAAVSAPTPISAWSSQATSRTTPMSPTR